MPPIVVIASGGNELTAVRAMRLGAADYLPRSAAQCAAAGDRAAPGAAHSPAAAQPRARPARSAATTHRSVASGPAAIRDPAQARRVLPRRGLPRLQHHARAQRRAQDQQADGRGRRRMRASSRANTPPSARCSIRSVVEIYDYGFHDGREFIAMEYFPCGDLKTRLQQPMSVAESLDYALRICGALRGRPWRRPDSSRSEAAERHAARGRLGGADRFRPRQGHRLDRPAAPPSACCAARPTT